MASSSAATPSTTIATTTVASTTSANASPSLSTILQLQRSTRSYDGPYLSCRPAASASLPTLTTSRYVPYQTTTACQFLGCQRLILNYKPGTAANRLNYPHNWQTPPKMLATTTRCGYIPHFKLQPTRSRIHTPAPHILQPAQTIALLAESADDHYHL